MNQDIRYILSLLSCLIFMVATGCVEPEDGETGSCLDALPSSCSPQYFPSFENVYTYTLSQSCAGGGSSCHSNDGRQGGLNLSSQETAYESLTSPDASRVLADDPACSDLMIRLESTTPGIAMPPGLPLSPEEKCAIMMWIEQGALP